MSTTIEQRPVPTGKNSQAENTRPLYVRRVPESVWNLVHINAIKSRMRLQTYLVRIMEQSEPLFPDQEGFERAVVNPTIDSSHS